MTDPPRHSPTNEEFHAIVDDIRRQPFNADAKDSADYVEFMGRIGLGQVEIATFVWGDFTTAEHAEKIRVKTGKGFFVPLFPGVRALLQRMRSELGYTPDPREPLFKQKDAKKALRGACERLSKWTKVLSQRHPLYTGEITPFYRSHGGVYDRNPLPQCHHWVAPCHKTFVHLLSNPRYFYNFSTDKIITK